MIQDPLLLAVLKKAEFDWDKHWQCCVDGAADENARLTPIVTGLCEEVERLRNSLQGIFTLLDDQVLVRNIDDDKDIMKFIQQSTRLTAHLSACKTALSTSALAKLGGGE